MKTATKEDNRVKGHEAGIKGLLFEQKVTNHFTKKDWKIETRKMINGGEFDIFGEKNSLWDGKKFLLVECKNKERVSSTDVTKFMRKVLDFHNGLDKNTIGDRPPITAVIAYSGAVDLDTKQVASNFKPKIEFEQF